MVLSSCSDSDIIFKNRFYELKLNGNTGSIKSIEKAGKNLIYTADSEGPLFTIRFRDPLREGEIHEFDAHQAGKFRIENNNYGLLTLTYTSIGNTDLKVVVTVKMSENSPGMKWNISIDNNTGYTIDHIDFPNVVVPDDLIGTGGTGRIFWPAQEGCLIEDIRIREESPWLKFKPVEYPKMGWGGFYPSSTQMQYMAYYNENGGLYLASHDEKCNPKGIEFHRVSEKGIKLDFRLFPGGAGKGLYTMPYDMVLEVFNGDWHDASAIYRDWRESSGMPVPPRIRDNKMLPDWYFRSPVVITYPVRGHKDMGDMTPNELYPYTNALKIIDKYNKAFDSKVMVLLMHWEGSAPWAPPYVWPPFGGEKNYLQFVKGLHDKGNLAGLYASGIGYTLRSNTDTTYNMYKEYEEKGLEKVMKVAPDGTLATNGVCTGPNAQRIGYDMCPANDFVREVVSDQILKIVASKTDYVQYFDQNLGGSCYPCYGTGHGHAYGPGLWQNDAMHSIFKGFLPILEKAGYKPIIGCEAAASEANLQYLLFNDARATINLFAGRPVPAYAFVNHEYVNNFMGNQNALSVAIDVNESPYNFLQRLAYSFCAGDMLTVILRGNGDMIWDWGTTWETDIPNQEYIIKLVKSLNSWRLGSGKDYLVYGRMQKPLPFEGAANIPMITRPGKRSIDFPSVFTSNWQSGNGRKSQFFVNYLPWEQEITLNINNIRDVIVFRSASENEGSSVSGTELKLKLTPLSAIMVSYAD
ncbi:MAG TPA: hypothetical protein DDW27_16245 [Bacteroidales bacterium]|nr:hypothetical protein [Bacteroidales bacterium]